MAAGLAAWPHSIHFEHGQHGCSRLGKQRDLTWTKCWVQVEKAAAGVAAGFVSTLATFPLETMRTCRSLSGSQGGLLALCRSIWSQGGARAFYRVSVHCELTRLCEACKPSTSNQSVPVAQV